MKTFERLFGVLLLLVGAVVFWSGLKLGYIRYNMPGAGFFPVWEGILVFIGGILLVTGVDITPDFPEGYSMPKQLLCLAMVFVYLLATQYLGALISTIALFFVLVIVIGKRSWMTFGVSTAASILILYASFELWLGIPLPRGIFDSY